MAAGISRHLYTFHVAIDGIDPPTWRRLAVPGNQSLQQFHLLLQLAFGWKTYHLYEFTIRGLRYALPAPDDLEADTLSSKAHSLDSFELHQGERFAYLYDFGDDWAHLVTVEGVIPIAPGMRYPLLLGGARACPPEDVGGAHGYQQYLAALKSPKTKAGRDALDWNGPFDPEKWDSRGVLRIFAPPSALRSRTR